MELKLIMSGKLEVQFQMVFPRFIPHQDPTSNQRLHWTFSQIRNEDYIFSTLSSVLCSVVRLSVTIFTHITGFHVLVIVDYIYTAFHFNVTFSVPLIWLSSTELFSYRYSEMCREFFMHRLSKILVLTIEKTVRGQKEHKPNLMIYQLTPIQVNHR